MLEKYENLYRIKNRNTKLNQGRLYCERFAVIFLIDFENIVLTVIVELPSQI